MSIQQGPTSEHIAGHTAKIARDGWLSVFDDVHQAMSGALRSPSQDSKYSVIQYIFRRPRQGDGTASMLY